MKKLVLLAVIFFFFCLSLTAQEAEITADEQLFDRSVTQNNNIIELDIRTSSLMELASWASSLGLSSGGTRNDLANRLRIYYGLPIPYMAVQPAHRTIIIESARTTEYFTLEAIDEEYARLSGNVSVSLRDGETVHRITAREILYNRTRNVMTASGGVVYVKEDGDTIETFRGESITVNLDNWSGIFLDGASERAIANADIDSAYQFAGTIVSTNDEEVTVMTNARITNPRNEDALWSLSASKLWLLPGSDWAVSNAVLRVGHVPVLWIPFFYYPSDEIVFHPVLGVRQREGTFLQTTTYILGRPKTTTTVENSLTRIFGGTPDGEVVREGLFLRATGRRVLPGDTPRLSVLFDAYANLGFYIGTELFLPRNEYFGDFDLSLGIGFTRNIYQAPFGSTPFANYDGTSEWNSNNYFFLMEVPFRYRMEMTGSASLGQGRLSWEIPLYSDPFVNRDFMTRSETLDWLAMLREGPVTYGSEYIDESISSYQMRLSGNYRPDIRGLSPYITSLSVSNISSSLSFLSRETRPYAGPLYGSSFPANPDSSFFFPDKWVILSVNANISGTPFNSSQVFRITEETFPALESILPANPITPWETSLDDEEHSSQYDSQDLLPPSLGQVFSISVFGGPEVSVNYSLSPSTMSELQFHNSVNNWRASDQIDWTEVSSVLSRVRSDMSLGLNVRQAGGNAYSSTFSLSGTGSWQDYNFIDEQNVAGGILAARRRSYNETFLDTFYNYSALVRPFTRNDIWRNTSFNYDLRGNLARYYFDRDSFASISDTPQWNWNILGWESDRVHTHNISARFEASIMDQAQNYTVTTVLPPRTPQLSQDAVFRFWISETRVRNTILEPFNDEKRTILPVHFTQIFRFTNRISFEQQLSYDPEINEYLALSSRLDMWGFSTRFQMSYMIPYILNTPQRPDYNPGLRQGWVQTGSREFVPLEWSLSYIHNIDKMTFGKREMSLSAFLRTDLVFDLQRYTFSRLNLSFGLEYGLSRFIDIQFITTSENEQMYRYFRNMPFFSQDVPLPAGAETNILADLINSFRFDNDNLRRQSAFKWRSFEFNLIHYLGDWNAILGIKLSPYLDLNHIGPLGRMPIWRFNQEISFMVRWIPIEEIRTEITHDRDVIQFR